MSVCVLRCGVIAGGLRGSSHEDNKANNDGNIDEVNRTQHVSGNLNLEAAVHTRAAGKGVKIVLRSWEILFLLLLLVHKPVVVA